MDLELVTLFYKFLCEVSEQLISKHLFFKGYIQQDFSIVTKIELNKINLVIYWYLMHFFTSCYFALKATKSLVFLAVLNQPVLSVRDVLKIFTKVFGKQWWWNTFLLKMRSYNLKHANLKSTLSCAKFSEQGRFRKLRDGSFCFMCCAITAVRFLQTNRVFLFWKHAIK